MSIKKLEEVKEMVFNDNISYMNYLVENVIDALKDHSDQIADLRQELAKKENCIDYDNIKIGGTD